MAIGLASCYRMLFGHTITRRVPGAAGAPDDRDEAAGQPGISDESAAVKASTSASVVSNEQTQRTSPDASSQV
ncbi:hypothetical protein GCM10009736_23270 [Actinomadura bangladeshensis]